MLKDVIREYDEHFPEIIERATYTLEKVGVEVGAGGRQLCGAGAAGKPCTLSPWKPRGSTSRSGQREALPGLSAWELPLPALCPPSSL